MIELMLANAAAGDPASIRALALLRALGFDDEQLRNAFKEDVAPVVERELEIWEILDMCVAGSKQRRREYWLQKHQ